MHPLTLGDRLLNSREQQLLVVEGRHGGSLSHGGERERQANPAQGLYDLGMRYTPSDPHPRERVGLGESPQHHDVWQAPSQGDPSGAETLLTVLAVGLVQGQNAPIWQAPGEALQLGVIDDRAGRVVGIGEQHNSGVRRDRGRHAVQVNALVRQRHWYRARPQAPHQDRIGLVGAPAEHHLGGEAGIGSQKVAQ